MDELVHFVKKLEEQDEENKMPNISRSTPKGNNVGKHNNGGGAKNCKVATGLQQNYNRVSTQLQH